MGKFMTQKHSKCLRVETKKEGKCPVPRIATFQHLCGFFINQRIRCSTVHYFNATVRLQGQQYLNLYYSKIYFQVQLKSQEASLKCIMML